MCFETVAGLGQFSVSVQAPTLVSLQGLFFAWEAVVAMGPKEAKSLSAIPSQSVAELGEDLLSPLGTRKRHYLRSDLTQHQL